MKAPGTAGPGAGLNGRTDGPERPLHLCGLNQRCRSDAVGSEIKKEEEEELVEKEKKVPDLYMYQNLEAILLFYLKHGHCHQKEKKREKNQR